LIRVLIWNEFWHERSEEHIKKIYPDGIHKVIADFLGKDEELNVRTATLEDDHCGITPEILAQTDVLIWWGHCRHDYVPDDVAMAVRNAVLGGMGFIGLHSAHFSKPFRLLMGTACTLSWRLSHDSELIWVVEPTHPIAAGIDRYIALPEEETYGEPFRIPTPDKLIFLSSFSGGEVFRSGCLYERGAGKIFYFQPGHESNPTYYNEQIQRVIRNAVHFVAPQQRVSIGGVHVRKVTDPEPYVIE